MKTLIILAQVTAIALALPQTPYKPPENEKRPPPSDKDIYEASTELPPIAPRDNSELPPIAPRTTLSCGTHTLSAGSYVIQSINHPNNYVNDHDCNYSLTTADGGDIDFSCSAFNVERNSQCSWDYVKFNGVKYCGTTAPPSSSYSQIEFEFHTDYSVVRTGFSCELTVSGGGSSSELSCGTHTLDEGDYTITSPNHPSNYGNNFDCDYTLTASDPAASLAISCSAFNIESHSTCRWDWLRVDGTKFCGTTAPSTTTTGSMNVDFHTDYSVTRTGYLCQISVTAGGGGSSNLACGTHSLDRGQYTIQSPNHPSNYDINFDCDYTLTATNSSDSVSITCGAFNIESHSRCSWDWLRVNSQKYCGTNAPSTSSDGSMNIDFHSDYSVVRSGYSCQIEVAEGSGGGGGGGGGGGSGNCCCGTPNRVSRIVGGQNTEVNEYPWQVALTRPGSSFLFCGGSIINSRYVMTAAHCVTSTSASNLQLLLREHNTDASDGEIRVNVANINIHPNYQSASTSGYDFALLKLSEELQFPDDNRVAPVCLPTDDSNMYVGSDAVVTGWGTLSSGGSTPSILQEVTVPVVSNAACNQAYGNRINPSMICAGRPSGGIDSCQGDSGGPMVTLESDRYNLIGVVSWGRGCALPGYPGVYARTTSVLSWIQSNTADGTSCS